MTLGKPKDTEERTLHGMLEKKNISGYISSRSAYKKRTVKSFGIKETMVFTLIMPSWKVASLSSRSCLESSFSSSADERHRKKKQRERREKRKRGIIKRCRKIHVGPRLWLRYKERRTIVHQMLQVTK